MDYLTRYYKNLSESLQLRILELQEAISPLELGKRVARIYGTKEDHGPGWEPAIVGKHIPLSNFDEDQSNGVLDRLSEVQDRLGDGNYENGLKKYKSLQQMKSFKIDSLVPTQPVVRTSVETLFQKKLNEKSPQHIIVVTHDGQDFIMDGHHSVMAARIRGDDEIIAKHFNLDEYH